LPTDGAANLWAHDGLIYLPMIFSDAEAKVYMLPLGSKPTRSQ
jgi:hypothetical protein